MGIRTMLKCVYEAYRQIIVERAVTSDMNEVDISYEFWVRMDSIVRALQLSFEVHIRENMPDKTLATRGKIAPMIDLAFVGRTRSEGYFGIECKILDGSPELNREYIEQGLERFISGKYSSACGVGSMMGYVRKGKIEDVALGLKPLIDATNCTRPFDSSILLDGVSSHFESFHTRSRDLGEFNIHHMFFSFDYST